MAKIKNLKLSILIPSLPEADSQQYLKRLHNILLPQVERYKNEVEIIEDSSPRTTPTGTKRNNMIARSSGKYFSQIDCDDLVPMYYVDELIKAINNNPDVITFIGYMTTDGKNRAGFTIKLGEKYEERNGAYFRWPNHLCAFKKELVADIKFEPVWQQEDYLWSRRIKELGLLKSEVHINKDMYHYDFKIKQRPSTVYSRRHQLR